MMNLFYHTRVLVKSVLSAALYLLCPSLPVGLHIFLLMDKWFLFSLPPLFSLSLSSLQPLYQFEILLQGFSLCTWGGVFWVTNRQEALMGGLAAFHFSLRHTWFSLRVAVWSDAQLNSQNNWELVRLFERFKSGEGNPKLLSSLIQLNSFYSSTSPFSFLSLIIM